MRVHRAIVEVETAGVTSGFGFRADRRPQILFERHVFRKYTNGLFDGEAPDVSGPAGGYGILSMQYGKLEKAVSLRNPTLVYSSIAEHSQKEIP